MGEEEATAFGEGPGNRLANDVEASGDKDGNDVLDEMGALRGLGRGAKRARQDTAGGSRARTGASWRPRPCGRWERMASATRR